MDIVTALSAYWNLLGWRSIAEITFFSSLIYSFSLWLRKDRQKNLLFSFYAYCSLAFGAYVLDIPLITHFMFLCFPAALLLFIIVHQEVLQKNFILMRTITPARISEHDWIALSMQSFLTAVHNNMPVLCVIEKHDSLKTVLASPITFDAPIQKDLLDIVLNSSLYDAHKMIWVNHHGQLHGINVSWQSLVDETWISEELQDLEGWKLDAVLLTNKTDALVFRINPENHTVDLVAQKRVLEQISITDAVAIIKRYLYGKNHMSDFVSPEYHPHTIIKGAHETIIKNYTRDQSLS